MQEEDLLNFQTKKKSKLIEILKERDDWTTKEIQNLIHEEFKVEYSLKQVGIILRNMGLKPYPKDYRRPLTLKNSWKKHRPIYTFKS